MSTEHVATASFRQTGMSSDTQPATVSEIHFLMVFVGMMDAAAVTDREFWGAVGDTLPGGVHECVWLSEYAFIVTVGLFRSAASKSSRFMPLHSDQ